METHAVPQEIMGVEFKLFGNFLSLREFIFIAVGLAIAYFFYFLMQRSVIPPILAVPAILFFGLGGILVGLVPIQDRSLDKWIVNYFSAINRPTQRVWKKAGITSQVDDQSSTGVVTKNHVVAPPVQNQSGVFKAGTTPTPKQADSSIIEVEKDETQDIQRIASVIENIESGTATQAPAPTAAAAPKSTTSTPSSTAPPSRATPTAAVTIPAPQQPGLRQGASIPQIPTTPRNAPKPTNPISTVPPIQTNQQQAPITSQSASTPSSSPSQPKAPPNQPGAPQAGTSQTATPKQTTNDPTEPAAQMPSTPTPSNDTAASNPNVLKIEDHNIKDYATTITSITNKPNTVNIVVKDAEGMILPGVVCVVKNPQGEPVRAAVSNVLGQILNNIPLKSGTYRISLSKQGYIFPEILRTIKGKTYPPIEIKAL